jgi:hypothetical protein
MSEAVKHLHDYDTKPRHRARVVSNDRITPEGAAEEVRELVLKIDRPDFTYQAL